MTKSVKSFFCVFLTVAMLISLTGIPTGIAGIDILSNDSKAYAAKTLTDDNNYFISVQSSYNKTAYINGLNNNELITDEGEEKIFEIPKTLTYNGENYTVTGISSFAFDGNSIFTKVILHDGIKEIDSAAFMDCVSLREINIDEIGLEVLGGGAFRNCTALRSITFPDTLTDFGSAIFYGCNSLKDVDLGTKITSLICDLDVNGFFEKCISLEKVTIPKQIETIGMDAFRGCTELTSVIIAAGSELEEIDVGAFKDCTELKTFTFEDKLKNQITLGHSVFSGCTKLETINFEKSNAKTIGSNTFENCTTLTKITLPDSATDVGGAVFYNCSNLNEVNLGQGIKTLSAPFGQDRGFFQGCVSLKKITIPKQISSISDYAFYGCTSLETVTVATGSVLSNIGWRAFQNCTNLKEFTFETPPVNQIEMEYGVFVNCTSLERIAIPAQVTAIDSGIFAGCTSLKQIHLDGNPEVDKECLDANQKKVVYFCSMDDEVVNYIKGLGFNARKCSDVPVQEIVPAQVGIELSTGDTYTLQYTVLPENAVNKNVSFSSSDTNIVTVDNSGNVTAKKAGTATITIKSESDNVTATVTVKVVRAAVHVDRITVTEEKVHLNSGESKVAQYTVLPGNADNKAVSFTSSDADVASVDANGKITAKKTGEVIITITSADGGKTAQITVTVTRRYQSDNDDVIVECPSETFDIEEDQVKLSVKPLEKTEGDSAVLGIKKGKKIVKSYDIKFVDRDNKYVPIKRNVKVRIVAPPELSGINETFVYHLSSGETQYKLIKATRNGRYFEFEADSFSEFSFVIDVNTSLKIKNNPNTATLKYRSTLTLTAETSNIPDECKVIWYDVTDGTEKKICEGNQCTLEKMKNGVKIRVKLLDEKGTPVTDKDGNTVQDEETVKIKNRFFDKVLYWLAYLINLILGKNAPIVQAL